MRQEKFYGRKEEGADLLGVKGGEDDCRQEGIIGDVLHMFIRILRNMFRRILRNMLLDAFL